MSSGLHDAVFEMAGELVPERVQRALFGLWALGFPLFLGTVAGWHCGLVQPPGWWVVTVLVWVFSAPLLFIFGPLVVALVMLVVSPIVDGVRAMLGCPPL